VEGLPWYLDLDTRPWEAYVDGRCPVLTLDFETTNIEHGDPRESGNRIVMTALRDSSDTMDDDSCPVLSDAAAWEMLRAHSGQPAILVAHNAKFELGWLNRSGIDTTHWLPWDTMIAEYVLAGNRRWPLDLDSVARRYGLGHKGRLIARLMKAGVCPSEMPDHLLRERVVWDVEKTYRLFKLQTQALAEMDLIRVQFTRCIFTPVVAAIEPEGLSLDPAKVAAEYERLVQRRAELLTELGTLAGGKKLQGPQLAELVYDVLGFRELQARGRALRTDPSKRFPEGQRKTDGDTLAALEAKTADQKRFIQLRAEYGSVNDALTKNLEFFQWVCEERGGTFAANFNQTRTGTHRTSSSGKRLTFKNGKTRGAQFQNLPKAYKSLFAAPPGFVYSEADGMGLEFRTGGSLARDPQIYQDVTTGADIHRYTASVLGRMDEAEVTKAQRQKAKPNTFKPMYGGQRGTKREMEYYAAFRTKYKVMNEMQVGWTHEVLKTGRLRTASGLIFYWPDTRMTNDGYITNTPSIFDYPIQSLATAEIIPVAITYLHWTIKARRLNARIVNTVHDSAIARVLKEDLDKYHECVVHCFLDRTYEYMDKVYGIDLFVPLGVAYNAGEHWGEGEEVSVSYPKGGPKSE